MYFPVGWPKYLKETQHDSPPLQYIISSCDRMLFAILCEDTISIWYCKPPVQIVNYTQSQRDLDKFGAYTLAEWKPDSSMIAVMTSKHHVIFFKVDLDISVPNHHCLYVQQEGKLYNTKKDLNGIPDSDSVPAIKIGPCSQLDLEASITCCLCVREDLVIATSDGHLNRIKWNGTKSEKNSLFIRDFPVSMDFQNTKAAKLTESDGYVVHMEYSPIIGGYIMVLSSGRAMFVIPPSTKADNGVAQGVWVKDLKDTVCLAVNHRYRLMAFGCKSGAGVVYVINEVEGTLEVSYKLSVSSKDYPDAAQTAGSVHCMKWTPDGTALALCWQNGGYSLWSVFGSLLVCSLAGEYSQSYGKFYPPPVKAMVSFKSPPVKAMVSFKSPPPVKAMVSFKSPPPVKAMVSLFTPVKAMVHHQSKLCPPPVKAMVSFKSPPPVKAMVSFKSPPPVKAMVSFKSPPPVKAMVSFKSPPPVKAMEWGLEGYQLWMVCGDQKEAHQTDYNDNTQCSHAMQLHFVKSALTVNPCSANHEHVFLQGEDKIYLNMGDSSQKPSHLESHVSVGNKLWQMIPISHSYLASNWPIRYAAVDKTGQCVAVAGKTGLAHYTCSNRKWKLFGNETQERDLVVSGGMSWWKDFICVACYNIVGQRDEIRCYPRGCKLDNTFSMSVKVPSQILLLNIFRDILIVFCIDSHIMLFNLERKNTQSNPALDINKRQEVSLNNYVPHPVCVTGLALSSLKTEYGAKNQHIAKEAESLLLNVAGKLLMFPRDNTGPQIKENNLPKNKPLPFCPPAMVATNVENMWTSSRVNVEKAQLMEALWLSCGAQGMKGCEYPSAMILVGGFSDSNVVRKAIKGAFPAIKTVVSPVGAVLSVLKGSVVFGHEPTIVTGRVCCKTIGVALHRPYNPAIHVQEKTFKLGGKIRVDDCFEKMFTVNEVVHLGQMKTIEVHDLLTDSQVQSRRKQPKSIEVYATQSDDPKYITDPGCVLLGRITVNPPGGNWPEVVEGYIEMKPGGTEITVRYRDKQTGLITEGQIDFI
ncbi:RAB6A-GEF complex partner protein 1 [Mytilus galloprovincialis]|uniref:RAB6A-GEF complex partner protein 1 n=1 Tax=Mytilus galloprovincialis TaxID=29158 RepID=A0A8B6BIG2_MYTGA|nr:RAB6A-GEF complex partner protein 1 [Mytilus galloprovincialis]